MKAILLATAMSLALASAAVAQDATSPAAQQPSNGQTPGDTSGAPASSMGDSSTPAPATPDASAPAPAPADASAPAPADASATPAPADASGAPAASTTDYPACSKSVTDKCVEKGGAHKAKKMKRK